MEYIGGFWLFRLIFFISIIFRLLLFFLFIFFLWLRLLFLFFFHFRILMQRFQHHSAQISSFVVSKIIKYLLFSLDLLIIAFNISLVRIFNKERQKFVIKIFLYFIIFFLLIGDFSCSNWLIRTCKYLYPSSLFPICFNVEFYYKIFSLPIELDSIIVRLSNLLKMMIVNISKIHIMIGT